MQDVYRKSFKEVYVILNKCSKEDYDKIPKNFMKVIEDNMDKDYSYTMNEDNNIFAQPMLRETMALLSIIYRDFWASKEEREKIVAYQQQEKKVIEEKKRNAYNVDNIFKKQIYNNTLKPKNNINEENKVVVKDTAIVKYNKNNFIKKIWMKFIELFKRK